MPNLVSNEIITIGSDPELAIVSPQGKLIDADRIIHGDGCSPSIEFGFDGHSATCEIRPRPANNPKDATQKIKDLLERNKSNYPLAYKNNLKAYHDFLSIGGHIHFGHKSLKNNPLICDQLASNLDILLSLPSMYLENQKLAQKRRTRQGYGRLHDWRPQAWGFEYRTLSSFISSRELTQTIFYVAYAIADATINHKLEVKPPQEYEAIQKAFEYNARQLLRPYLPDIFSQLTSLPKYTEPDYKKQINHFVSLVKKESPLWKLEIKKGWSIVFNLADFLKLENIESLIDKVLKVLVQVNAHKLEVQPINYIYAQGSQKDLACPEIAQAVNMAINKIIDNSVIEASNKIRPISIYGLSPKRGNEIRISTRGFTPKAQKRVLGYFWAIASQLTHQTKISEIKFTHSLFTLGLGRKIREENLLLAEAMAVILVLLRNRDLFRQSETIKGKEKKLRLTTQRIAEPVIKNIKDIKPIKIKMPLLKHPLLKDVTFPIIIDCNKSWDIIIHNIMSATHNDKDFFAQKLAPYYKKLTDFKSENIDFNYDCQKCSNYMAFKKLCRGCLARSLDRIINHLPIFRYINPRKKYQF